MSAGVKIEFLAGITNVLWYYTGLTSLFRFTVKLMELTDCIFSRKCRVVASKSNGAFLEEDSSTKFFFCLGSTVSSLVLNFLTC